MIVWARWQRSNLANLLKITKFGKIMFYSETENDGVVLIWRFFPLAKFKRSPTFANIQ
jgi:hypothetical protein